MLFIKHKHTPTHTSYHGNRHISILYFQIADIVRGSKLGNFKYGHKQAKKPKMYQSQNAKRASARKDTGLDQSLFSVQLFRLRINIIKVYKGSI